LATHSATEYTPHDDPDLWQDEYDERAAIAEHHGRLDPVAAARLALERVRALYPASRRARWLPRGYPRLV